ncbi:MAG: KH domain-containing protein [bacterium]|nr:KH domain-containing protein [bacterium]
MKDLLLYLVKSMVDHPEEVEAEEIQKEETTLLSFQVNPSDMGKVIGKQGKIIKALRNVIKILATKEGKRVDIELKETAV